MKISTSQILTKSNKIFCLVGPSGTGKSTLAEMIPLPEVVSYKTRKIRDGEIEGKNGFFISEKEFLEMNKRNLWLAKTYYSGNYYGITQGEIFELEHSPMIYVIDWEGYEIFKDGLSEIEGYSEEQLVTIFIHTPRYDLEARMKHQQRDPEEIRARLDHADREYAISNRCDYTIKNINGELDRAAFDIMKIILKESFNHETKSIHHNNR